MVPQRSTVGSLLRSTQAYCAQLSDKETLDEGIAYYCAALADLPEANQFREVMIGDAGRFSDVFASVERWYAERDLLCHRWAPAGGQPDAAMSDHLSDRGFRAVRSVALALSRWVDLRPDSGVRILPARALRAAYRATFSLADGAPPAAGAAMVDAAERRLDDPQYDMFVALIDDRAAGRGALYQVGDIARVIDVAVIPGFDHGGVGRALLAHALTLARRLAIGNVCAQLDSDAAADLDLFRAAGFVADGEIVEYHRDPARGAMTAP